MKTSRVGSGCRKSALSMNLPRPFYLSGLVLFAGLSLASLSAQDDFDMDSLFEDPEALEIVETAPVEGLKTAPYTPAFIWAGDFTGNASTTLSWNEMFPEGDEWLDPDESPSFGLGARLWFDSRPERSFRVFGKVSVAWPFNKATTAKIDELYSDFNWSERLFFRFGKQNAGWGVSRFYQIADPLSVGVKNPEDPEADLDGPLALRVSLPLGVNALYLYGVVKDSYLPENAAEASITDAALGIKADILVKVPANPLVGNGELSLGAYAQKRLAPKFVASYSTSVGKVQFFTDQAVSYGLDYYRLDGGVDKTVKTEEVPFWSATAGAMYVNQDAHLTVYAEYLFNAAGSASKTYYKDWLTRYGLEQIPADSPYFPGYEKTLVLSDAFGYLSRHNSAVSVSFSELFNTDKLSASAFWMQNWVDRSGMAQAALGFKPFKTLKIEPSAVFAWGADTNEWVIKNSSVSAETGEQTARRFALRLAVSFGSGKF